MKEVGDRRFTLPKKSRQETSQFVLRMLRHKPGLSADALSAKLGDFGIAIPPRTMRNIYKVLGVSTAEERKGKSLAYLTPEISPEDWDVIFKEIENGPVGELSGRNPGDVLVQDRVQLPSGYCDQRLAVEIIVDTFSSSRRIYAMVGTPSHKLSVDALAAVLHCYQTRGTRIHTFYAPRKNQYSAHLGAVAYPRCFMKPAGPLLEVRPTNSRTIDSRIQAAWTLLRSSWLKTLPTRLPLDDRTPNQIEDDLEEWLVKLRA